MHPACPCSHVGTAEWGHAQPRLRGVHVHQLSCPTAELLGHRLNPEKQPQRPLCVWAAPSGLPPLGPRLGREGCCSPSPRVRAEAPRHGSLLILLGGYRRSRPAHSRTSRPGCPPGLGTARPPYPLWLLWSLSLLQPVHTVTLPAPGFAVLIRPEDNSKRSSRQL